jgi:8-oxo-dGTP diphosphatase
MTDPESRFARPEVAVAVVTSHLGVLVGRRRDGRPPWTFPGGKIEPGESPKDAAVRETLEETGLRVRAAGMIGSRAHPVTGVRMMYVAGELVTEPGVLADGSGQLAEVRWVDLAEADELMADMCGDVRQHLARMLGG